MKVLLQVKKRKVYFWLPALLVCRAVLKRTKAGNVKKARREIIRALRTCNFRGEFFRFEQGEVIVSVRR